MELSPISKWKKKNRKSSLFKYIEYRIQLEKKILRNQISDTKSVTTVDIESYLTLIPAFTMVFFFHFYWETIIIHSSVSFSSKWLTIALISRSNHLKWRKRNEKNISFFFVEQKLVYSPWHQLRMWNSCSFYFSFFFLIVLWLLVCLVSH